MRENFEWNGRLFSVYCNGKFEGEHGKEISMESASKAIGDPMYAVDFRIALAKAYLAVMTRAANSQEKIDILPISQRVQEDRNTDHYGSE